MAKTRRRKSGPRRRVKTSRPTRPAHDDRVFDFAPVMYVELDSSGLIRDINVIACQMLGVERARMIGIPFRTQVLDDDRLSFLEHLRQCRGSDRVIESELRLCSHSDGSPIPVRLYSRMSRARDAFPTLAIDLTEYQTLEQSRQRAIEQRERAEREREVAVANEAAKDQLIAVVSHELRNPLSPALAAADALAGLAELPDHVRELAAIIKRNVLAEARLVDDLLDVARVNRGQIELQLSPTDVHEGILDAITACAPAAEARRVSIAVDLAARHRYASADEGRLRQVFWNLLNNALKFSDLGGHILVRTINDSPDTVRVVVRDQGEGMTQETLDQLFRPFPQTEKSIGHRGGLGLGLTIARGIIDAHGGRLFASSHGPGRGSTFEVELNTCEMPTANLTTGDDEQLNHAVAHASHGVTPIRVLIVEDHRDTGTLLSMFLSQHGCDVTLAPSLADGLRQLSREWHTVLSDIGLPDGSGLEIARRFSSLPNRPNKIIALSGFGAARDLAASYQAGFDQHLVKPVDLNRLLEIIAEPVKA